MKGTKILMILLVLAALLVCFEQAGQAAPMGTAFTYQGHLYDANSPANGLYDFQFKLFDAFIGANQLGSDVNAPNVDVFDGYFAVELDFGSVFDGNSVWLQTGVRPGDLNDPNVYTTLTPRQEIAPTPYAVYAAKAAAVVGGDPNYIPKFIKGAKLGNSVIYESAGNIGIGTTSPSSRLEVAGTVHSTSGGFKFPDGTTQTSALPSGVIVMWSGSIAAIPTGWALCDGTNGTPDLTSGFIRSIPNASTDPGSTGGSSTHTHGAGSYSASAHTHTYSGTTGGPSDTTQRGDKPEHSASTTHTHTYSGTTSSGGGGSISGTSATESSLPPYYELAFIMRL